MASSSPSERIDGVGVLFGFPIKHSMSPLLHNTGFKALGLRWRYEVLESQDINDFLAVLKDPRCYGSGVTMPYKVAILKHLDELTPQGRDVGAVNTIIVKEENGSRKYIGTNTDVNGIRDSFYQNVENPEHDFHNRPGLVVGGGGAARGAVYALQRWMRCKPIYIINRDAAEVDAVIKECQSRGFGSDLVHVSTIEQAEKLEGPGAIVACVPNFPPKTPEELTARRTLECMLAKPHKGAILEMCYHPSLWTEIAEISKLAGWKVILGTEAMIYQGVEQARLWTGKDVTELPVKEVKAAIAAEVEKGCH